MATMKSIKAAFAVKGRAKEKKQLRAAIQAALEAAPEARQEAVRRYHVSMLAAADSDKQTAREIADVFLIEAINLAPAAERDAVQKAIDELLKTEMDIDAYYAQAYTPAHLQDPVDAYPPEQREAVRKLREEVLNKKLQVEIEPRSTAEAICKDAGVPTGMADKMIVAVIK